jgi:hypothetical protein
VPRDAVPAGPNGSHVPLGLHRRTEAGRHTAGQIHRCPIQLPRFGTQPGEDTGPLLPGQLLGEHPAQILGAVGGDHRPVDGQLLDLIELQGATLSGDVRQRPVKVVAQLLTSGFTDGAILPAFPA